MRADLPEPRGPPGCPKEPDPGRACSLQSGRSRAGHPGAGIPESDLRGELIMARYLKIAAAQMGPNQEGTSRDEIVERMLALLADAVHQSVELIAYPEMALTTYFPKRIRKDFDQFFEAEVPPKALEPLLRRAAEARVAVHVGFCEKADRKYFNTALLTDRDGRLRGTLRKIHLPGTQT